MFLSVVNDNYKKGDIKTLNATVGKKEISLKK
jgi:hypothetical protein